jgi:hypothetical protein
MGQQSIEKDLIQKAAYGDTTAFGEIIKKYQNLVFATACKSLETGLVPKTSPRMPLSPNN